MGARSHVRASPRLRNLAGRLLAIKTGGKSASAGKTPAVVDVCDELRPSLAALMGHAGFRALLSRALALASTEASALRALSVETDGTLAGWEKLSARLEASEIAEGGVVLLARLLGLLVAFIGEDLTLRLIRDVWPRLPLHDLEPGKKAENEKAS